MLAWSLLWLVGCMPPKVVQRMYLLETRVQALEGALGVPSPPTPETEAAAERLLTEAYVAAESFQWDVVRKNCVELTGSFANTLSGARAVRDCGVWSIVGTSAIGFSGVERWFVGSEPAATGPTLLVFAEEWCPHCQRELPRVQELSVRWTGRIQVVGITQGTNGSTDEKISAWLANVGVTFPFGKENGALSEHYGVHGIPAAALVKDGVVVWRGHPSRLDDIALETLIR